MSDLNFPKPAETLEVIVGGSKTKIFMSFGLLRRVTSLVGGMGLKDGAIGSFLLEGENMAALVDLLLEPKDFDVANLRDHEISHEEALGLAMWGLRHALYFFARNLTGLQELTEESAPLLKSLMPSEGGSTP